MGNYIGFDLSLSSTGFAVVTDKGVLLDSGVIKSKQKGVKRLLEITEKVISLFVRYEPILICIEGYGFASNTVAWSAELGGHVKCELEKAGATYLIVGPNQLKKFVTGKGAGKKNIVMMHAFKKYGIEFDDDNECDAFILAMIAQAYVEDIELNKAQQEVMKKLRGENGKRKATRS